MGFGFTPQPLRRLALDASPLASAQKQRNQVIQAYRPDGSTAYWLNGTMVANPDWQPDPGTDNVIVQPKPGYSAAPPQAPHTAPASPSQAITNALRYFGLGL